MGKNTLLMILDGWGITQDPEVSAIAQASTPYIDSLYKNYPHAQLLTHGEHVGLPAGQMGNSEVGHMNLGAGRIVFQDLARINNEIKENAFAKNPVLVDALAFAKANSKKVHLLGLLSDGGVHAHTAHLKALIDAALSYELEDIFIHAFTDGRDVDPHSGIDYIKELQQYVHKTPAQLATVIGRYFAMDRDTRWERVARAYDLLVNGLGKPTHDIDTTIQESYDNGITDEFIEPTVLLNGAEPVATIDEGDVIIFFNYRTDRGRELTNMLSQQDHPKHDTKKLKLHYVTMTTYDETFKNIEVLYKKDNLKDTIGETLSTAGKKQIRIAETEKYPHVTFFFNGGKEQPFNKEHRIICKSPHVATYDLQPEMSINCVQEKIIPEINNKEANFICLNYANPDMVGHTGSMEAAIAACEAVDNAVEHVVNAAIENDYCILIIADHGNCEVMLNKDGTINTAHTTNPVPIIVVDKDIDKVKDGILADIAPTLLSIMNVEIPALMTGKVLV